LTGPRNKQTSRDEIATLLMKDPILKVMDNLYFTVNTVKETLAILPTQMDVLMATVDGLPSKLTESLSQFESTVNQLKDDVDKFRAFSLNEEFEPRIQKLIEATDSLRQNTTALKQIEKSTSSNAEALAKKEEEIARLQKELQDLKRSDGKNEQSAEGEEGSPSNSAGDAASAKDDSAIPPADDSRNPPGDEDQRSDKSSSGSGSGDSSGSSWDDN